MCYACRPGAAAVGIEWSELIKVQPSKNIQVSRVQRFVRCRSSELQISLLTTENTQGPSNNAHIARAYAVRVVISVHVVFVATLHMGIKSPPRIKDYSFTVFYKDIRMQYKKKHSVLSEP